MATLAEIYDWFMTGKKPTQAQFWASWGSFWNKNESIPQSAVSGLTNVLNAKVENDQFNAHKGANDAHAALFLAKEDKTQKGAPNGYAPLDEFTKLAAQYLNIVNDLVTGGATALLSAEQGKVLQTQVNAINTLLTSDNVNLDTVQELVDAIETVQLSLSSILVNDLTTGGTTKALTAEMGKTLKVLVDTLTTTVNGKQATLVSGTNIKTVNGTSLLGSGDLTVGVTRTLKTITSANLTTQDAAGFVAYINALGAPLVVAANEIVEYQLSDTGRVFKLLLGGRSFGTGQPAITTADVENVTLWMDKDVKLSNYGNSRNDGQLATNKILSTDSLGNLKLYTIPILPAPYLLDVIPDSYAPSNTGNFVIKGAFFTPTMTVSIQGQTVNYLTFISDNEVRANVTTGAAEGAFDVTLNNGLQTVVPKRFLVILGTVYSPTAADWINKTGQINAVDKNVYTTLYNITGSAQWNKQLDYTKNFEVRITLNKTPLGTTNGYQIPILQLLNASNLSEKLQINKTHPVNNVEFRSFQQGIGGYQTMMTINNAGGSVAAWDSGVEGAEIKIKWISGVLYSYYNGALRQTYTVTLTENVYLKLSVHSSDVTNVKYIETV